MPGRKRTSEYHAGPQAAWRFDHALRRVLSVSKQELESREAAYQEARKHRSRSGPKPKKATT